MLSSDKVKIVATHIVGKIIRNSPKMRCSRDFAFSVWLMSNGDSPAHFVIQRNIREPEINIDIFLTSRFRTALLLTRNCST